MKYTWDFQLCAWFSVAVIECVSLTPDAWELTGLEIKVKAKPSQVTFKLAMLSIARFSPQTMQWYN